MTKRRDYEDNVVKVFYLRNITSVQEFQEIVTAVRSITDIRRMFTYNAQNAVMASSPGKHIPMAIGEVLASAGAGFSEVPASAPAKCFGESTIRHTK